MNLRYHLLASFALVPATLATGCESANPPESEDPVEDNIASTRQSLSTPDYIMPQNGGNPLAVDINKDLLLHVWQYPLKKFSDTLAANPNIPNLFNTGMPTSAEHLMEESLQTLQISDLAAAVHGAGEGCCRD